MRSAEPDKVISIAGCLALLRLITVCACMVIFSAGQAQPVGINETKHNLSVTGPGPIKALTETRICVFCHTPHNSTPNTPLWNKEVRAQTYNVYTSPTLQANPLPQPTGPTKLCLSCHDGTIALGAIANPATGITMGGPSFIPPGSPSFFGIDLSTHHPVSFPYGMSNPQNNPELVPLDLLPPSLQLGGLAAEVHCNTCHNPHDDTYGKFLVMENRFSALCTSCHQMTGWNVSSHATIEQGCEVCHTPHFASDIPLLNYTSSDYCLTCHSPVPSPPPPTVHGESALSMSAITAARAATAGRADISSQIKKWSAHKITRGASLAVRGSKRKPRPQVGDISCSDCHNPHAVNRRKASSRQVSGMLEGVSGVDRNGMKISSVSYEYEVCFKCHGDYTSDIKFIPRVVNTANKRTAFDPSNASYHPVVAMGMNITSPSIPSTLEPGMSASAVISCTDCHRDDAGGSKGPHGSTFAPILREKYETADNTPESYQNYALCYRCHNRTSILSDVSFQKKTLTLRKSKTGGGHSGHLASGVPCSACHDPHGVTNAGGTATGDHAHLINFDTRIVAPPKVGGKFPVFARKGAFSGSCTLVCHGWVHASEAYP